MAITSFFKRNWVHFAAVALFLIIGMIYFSKQLQGYGLKQHDIEQSIGMAHEIDVYREHHDGEEPLWTNSMFGGMPAMQVSTFYHGNWFSEITIWFLTTFPSPMGIVILYMLCFYAALSMMKVNRWVAIIGALTFAFLSYDIIILQAGHNSKGVAIAFMAPVIGAFYMAYRRNWVWGVILSAVFMAFEMAANHLQVTYYLGFLLLALGLVEVYRVIREKNYMHFLKVTFGIVAAYGLALVVNFGNIKLTSDYAEYSIRGANDLTINPDGTSNASNSTEGLNRDYVVEYSLGKDESFTLISPYVKGGGSMFASMSPFAEDIQNNANLSQDQVEMAMNNNIYWGDQPSVAGPVYLGVILVLLALLGLVYVKDPMKWALLAATVITLMLSWGKNYMGLTNWFLDNVPGYDKFRAVTIILVIVELCVPLLAILFLDKLVKEREQIKANIRPFYITLGAFFLLLVILRVGGIEKSYLSERERDPETRERQAGMVMEQIQRMTPEQLAERGINPNDPAQIAQIIDGQKKAFDENMQTMQIVRKDIFNASMNRSILFLVLGGVCLFLLFKTSVPTAASLAGLGLLMVVDTMSVSRNYLNNEELGSGYRYWDTYLNTRYPISEEEGDKTIIDTESALSPNVRKAVEAGRREGERKALELDAVGSESKRIEDAYAYAALNEKTNYRVLDYSGMFGSARASYFHKSLGGYHGAKLRSIQNLYYFHIITSNNKVLNMLNVKYLQQQTSQDGPLLSTIDTNAMGNGWFVKKARVVPDANTEIRALGAKFDMKNEAAGKLIVNGMVVQQATLYGGEKLSYLMPGKDSIRVSLANGVPKGMKVYFVQDVNGRTLAVPQQTIDNDTTGRSFTKLVSYVVTEEFDLPNEAIVRQDMAGKLSQKQFGGEGTVKMTSYSPKKLTYDVNASDKGLVVFSEIYYPEGWTATIDGKPAEILRVNYLLRGLEVPKGSSKVEFTFDLPKFHSYNNISRITSLLILLLIAGAGYFSLRKRKEPQTGEAA